MKMLNKRIYGMIIIIFVLIITKKNNFIEKEVMIIIKTVLHLDENF